MLTFSPYAGQDFMPAEFPLDDVMFSYLDELSTRSPETISFRTGSGRIFRDLLLHWPILDGWEDEALEFCSRVTDASFPLVGSVYAQAVEVTAVISQYPIHQPSHIDALSTYLAYDTATHKEKHFFIAPKNYDTQIKNLKIEKGVVVMCRPLNYLYHTMIDDREFKKYPSIGIFELAQRLINEIYEKPPFISRELEILAALKLAITALPEKIATSKPEHYNVHQTSIAPQSVAAIAATSSISALPQAVREVEKQIMSHVMDKSISPETRQGLRNVAQVIRNAYPQAVIVEEERIDTHPRSATPQATPQTKEIAPLIAQASLQTATEKPNISPATIERVDNAMARTPPAAVKTEPQQHTHPLPHAAIALAAVFALHNIEANAPNNMERLAATPISRMNQKKQTIKQGILQRPHIFEEGTYQSDTRDNPVLAVDVHNYSKSINLRSIDSHRLEKLTLQPALKPLTVNATGRSYKPSYTLQKYSRQIAPYPFKRRLWAGISSPSPLVNIRDVTRSTSKA